MSPTSTPTNAIESAKAHTKNIRDLAAFRAQMSEAAEYFTKIAEAGNSVDLDADTEKRYLSENIAAMKQMGDKGLEDVIKQAENMREKITQDPEAANFYAALFAMLALSEEESDAVWKRLEEEEHAIQEGT